MLRRLNEMGLIWPALFAAAGAATLVGLGWWQLERRAWKLDLMAKIEARVTAKPVPLAEAVEAWRRSGDAEYVRVRARGRFLHDRESYVYVPGKDGPGYHVYTPLKTQDGWLVLVNRGFVPEALKSPDRRSVDQEAGEKEVIGLVRLPTEKNWFIPAGDPAQRLHFWPDHAGMLAAVSDPTDGFRPAPFFLDAVAEPGNPGGWPKGGTTRLNLPNRHLEYALTWFGLAVALAAVFAAFALSRLRDGAGQPSARRPSH
ncbi:MAG TPA: SURF1 family protein [Hyphomicrobiaceae bacterium]|nr:SURF1 family protein [Hyphomicrobiaceae bacterium]